MKLKKVTYPSSLSHFSLSYMHKATGEAVLLNSFFFKSSASTRKLLVKLVSKKIVLLVKLRCAEQSLSINSCAKQSISINSFTSHYVFLVSLALFHEFFFFNNVILPISPFFLDLDMA